MKINLVEYFDDTVRRNGQKTAVIDGDQSISFSELADRSKTLASKIILEKGITNKPVAVYLPKCIASVYADLAIIYSGNIYMNLDIKTPNERIKNIIELIQPEIIISNTGLFSAIASLLPASVSRINVDDISTMQSLSDDSITKHRSGLIDTDPLCIINTPYQWIHRKGCRGSSRSSRCRSFSQATHSIRFPRSHLCYRRSLP